MGAVSQGSFAVLTGYGGTSGVSALVHDLGAVMVVVVEGSLFIRILQFIHAMGTSLLIILFPILIHLLVSLEFPVIIAVHSRLDLLLGVEIGRLLLADTWLHDSIIIGAMSTWSGSIAAIMLQNQVCIQLKVVNMNLFLK